MFKISLKFFSVLTLCLPVFGGSIFLVGSDAATYHGYAPFGIESIAALQNSSNSPGLPVLILTDGYTLAGVPASPGAVYVTSLLGVTLGNYSALYLGSPSYVGPGCCYENDAAIAGHEGAINAFLTGGGSLAIQNYQGGAAFMPILGFVGTASDTFGFNTPGDGWNDFDGITVTALGSAYGFTTPPDVGAFAHQGYLPSAYAGYGFSALMLNPDGTSPLVVAETAIPEPASALLLGAGLLILGVFRRKLCK